MRRLGCIGLVLGLLAVATLFWVVRDWREPGRAHAPLTVAIPAGATLTGAAAELEQAGAIGSARRFVLLAKLFGGRQPIRAGEYRVPARMSAADLLKMLQLGRTLQRLVTIPEGRPAVMVRDALMNATELVGPVAVPPEGSVLPDSYGYDRGEARRHVLARMQAAMTRYLAEAWARRSPATAAKTPAEALILASIVEKETGKPAERRLVAAVYSNRLRRGMLLQADPTTIYPITKGRALGRKILRSELAARNGYNTYAMPGLPIGPITNPGRASIDAVLDPARSNALYLVADGSGGHAFADTLAQHDANVKKWQAFRAAHGI